jgi:hypothetical protein
MKTKYVNMGISLKKIPPLLATKALLFRILKCLISLFGETPPIKKCCSEPGIRVFSLGFEISTNEKSKKGKGNILSHVF